MLGYDMAKLKLDFLARKHLFISIGAVAVTQWLFPFSPCKSSRNEATRLPRAFFYFTFRCVLKRLQAG